MAQAADQPLVEIPELTDERRRGGACARCGMPVPTGSAVDLGARRDVDGVRVFPRACPGCAEWAERP
ncbi:hypothetical protein [Streptomyces sp. NRRL F-5126]|uniref:hypothetical protein n=1 Tax=Streptomyces sp. NRRL F-5126 TaxID=1463857 RepID=UPI00056A7702|nr:hypothetical protein [Streptomyces sp. NRRL F-5126]